VNPLYLGTSERRIYAIYEPAAVGRTRSRAAVLCYPWGAEYVYAHRSMRQLAIKLSMAGFHTLRFDYFGTGDSAGDMTDADLSGWETDVESAIEGIRDIAGTTQVTLIGLRLGATIAARVARRLSNEVEALVLWDPIISGEEYLRGMGVTSQPGEASSALEVQGFPLTPKLLSEFLSVDLHALISPPPTRLLLLVTQRMPSHDALSVVPAAPGLESVAIEYMSIDCPWIEAVTITGAIPVRLIQRIVDWLG
jgi:uncharacterized protein